MNKKKREPKKDNEDRKTYPITVKDWKSKKDLSIEPKQEIVGYRLKPFIDRMMVDGILKNAMPIWNDEDKSVYFIRGHVAGSLVAKMKELQVLDLWFIPIYEDEEIKSDWAKEQHIEYYHKEGIMKEEPKGLNLKELESKLHTALENETEESFANWLNSIRRQERMYSEEDIINALHSVELKDNKDYSKIYNGMKEWFEQRI
jgi:hypothetical protein